MKLSALLAAALLGLVLAPLPAATADDPCRLSVPVASVRDTHVDVLKGDCAGVRVWNNTLPCAAVEWGLMTSYAGVGGHSGCEVRAYVGYWWTDILP